jgi:CheY-like chemotaxis protein
MADILVIDDDAQIRRLLGAILTVDGHTVREAADGAEGVTLYGAAVPDLVLCDLDMPGMDGLATMRALRQLDAGARIVVITGGAIDGHDATTLAQQAGAVLTVTKPFDVNLLRTIIRGVLTPQ